MKFSKHLCLMVAFIILALFVVADQLQPGLLWARNINQYKDTISTSAPNKEANHTLSFFTNIDIGPGAVLEIIPPTDFEVTSDSTFSELRNVELRVNGTLRDVGAVQTATDDVVEITPGVPGLIKYTLNTTSGWTTGSEIEIKIGNHTSRARKVAVTSFDSFLGVTTTVPADTKPIRNSSNIGEQTVTVRINDGVEVANAGFVIALIETVGVSPVDTTEDIPPLRFNGAPTGTLSGTTRSVEVTLETDEFSICKYSSTPGVSYDLMTDVFGNTSKIFHNKVVSVLPAVVYRFYVRCMDDEFNKNIDDYVISFDISATPTGVSNANGTTSGNGTGSGNNGTGSGSGGGGASGASDGQQPTTGGSIGLGGSGGGGGGGSGGGSGVNGGGGFETTDGPYRSGDAQVTISGFTAPRSTVTTLVDGKIAQTATAGTNGEFSITILAIARGAYTFGIYSTDAAKVRSSTFSTSFTVTGARASALSNILIAPTVLATPDPVNPGQVLTLSGYAVPNAALAIDNEKEGNTSSRKSFTAQSNAAGVWSVTVDTNGLAAGTYKARAKATLVSGLGTNYSTYTLYGVGQAADRGLNSDLNRDGKVNLVDFSILLFWWGTAGGDSNPPADINADTKVNLTDFSILLFNWTG